MAEIVVNHGSPSNCEVVLEPAVHYVCQRCTACCKWPGDVRLESDEVAPIAEFLGLSESDFLSRFTRLRTNRQGLSLLEKPDHECIISTGMPAASTRSSPGSAPDFRTTGTSPAGAMFAKRCRFDHSHPARKSCFPRPRPAGLLAA